MRDKKAFNAPVPIEVVSSAPAQGDASTLLIALPENPTSQRTLNLMPWLGRNIDPWVWACAGQLRAFIASREIMPSTVVSCWHSGMRYFFEFLVAIGTAVEPQQIDSKHMRQYIGWLKDRGLAYGAQKNIYTHTKSVLVALIRRGIVPNREGLFPVNPFPGNNSRAAGATSLSPTERQRLAHALRDDVIAIHKGQFDGPDSAAMVVYLLAVAIRTGSNTTPLLEVSRDCLRPHPFLPNMMLVELIKRRGNATKLANLRYSRQNEGSLAIPMDGVALIQKALQLSEPMVGEARPEHRNRVWLYRTQSNSMFGQVSVLTSATLASCISELVKRHNLCADDGNPLDLNLSRLRKTLEQRLWRLSGGDLIATAELMGHAPKVADTHYLSCTRKMRENATFVGEALPDIYSQGLTGLGAGKIIPILPGKSPTGRCKDPYHGDKAPKNGSPCDDFFSCFTCASYAIVGSPEDLHRLFSFYWFLEREMIQARSNDWRVEFRNTMNLIERFTADKFDADLVAAAKARASVNPVKFWASYTLSNQGGGHG